MFSLSNSMPIPYGYLLWQVSGKFPINECLICENGYVILRFVGRAQADGSEGFGCGFGALSFDWMRE